MLATRKGLSHQLTAAHVYEQSGLAKAIIDSYVVQPALTGYVMEAKLKELSTKLAGLQALAHPLKERPELVGHHPKTPEGGPFHTVGEVRRRQSRP